MYESRFLSAVETLLYQHDCVILPNFGGFVAHYQPAQIHFLAATMSPPARRLSFNDKLISDDGLLLNYIAAQNNWTAAYTAQEVAAWVEQLNSTLANAQTLTLDKLGRVYIDADSSAAFEQNSTNFLRASFALPMVEKIQIFASKTAADTADTAKNYRPLIARSEAAAVPLAAAPKKGFNPKKMALLVVLLLVLPLLIWLLFFRTSAENNNQTASDLPPYSGITTITEPATTDTIAAISEPIVEDKPIVETTTTTTTTTTVVENTDPNTNTYIVIIGAFMEPPNAKRLLRRLEKEGYFPDVATTNSGLQRIGIQITCAPKELKLHIRDIRKKFTPEAWLLKS
jgi:nucleoid DNA-binding protein/cell division septation protein DedD